MIEQARLCLSSFRAMKLFYVLLPSIGIAFATIDSTQSYSSIKENIELSLYKEDFPILSSVVNDHPLVYLDNAASSHKPRYVLEAMTNYYTTSHSNVHRGAHFLANKATVAYENARLVVQKFINAEQKEEIIFTSGATASINIIAHSLSQSLQPGDEILLSVMEHHSNLVPWQIISQKTGAILKFVTLNDSMEYDLDVFNSLLSPRTKLVAVVHASNVLGTVNPIREIVQRVHEVGALVLLDACQTLPHMPVDVKYLDVDFLVASSHKMCGPTGLGILYGKCDILKSLPPVFAGGQMIDRVELESSTYALPPARFEPGTPPIAEAVGLAAACAYLSNIGMENIENHVKELGSYLYSRLKEIKCLTLYGPPAEEGKRTGLVAFNCNRVGGKILAAELNKFGIAVRAGHFCCQPLHKYIGVENSLRASVYFYNNKKDVDIFIEGLKAAIQTCSATPSCEQI